MWGQGQGQEGATPRPPGRTDELSKAPDGQAARPRHKLQQPDPLLIVHLLNHLQQERSSSVGSWSHPAGQAPQALGWAQTDLPEPLDLFAVLGVVPVDGVFLPVVHVDLLHPAQHQLGTGDTQQGTDRTLHSRFEPQPLWCQPSPGPGTSTEVAGMN